MTFILCQNCVEIISDINLFEELKNYPDIKKPFIEIFVRLVQLAELEGKKPKKEDIKPISLPNFYPTTYPYKTNPYPYHKSWYPERPLKRWKQVCKSIGEKNTYKYRQRKNL